MPIATGNAAAMATLLLAWFAFFAVFLTARRRRGESGGPARRDWRSVLGILVQGIAFALVFAVRLTIVHHPDDPAYWRLAALVGGLSFGSAALFVWAATTLGRNWSLVARTLAEHQLVTSGPFRFVRHPIYVAMFGIVVAAALAFGRPKILIEATPIYWLGTLFRTSVEEALLRSQFGAAYDDYARRTKRFVPGLI